MNKIGFVGLGNMGSYMSIFKPRRWKQRSIGTSSLVWSLGKATALSSQLIHEMLYRIFSFS